MMIRESVVWLGRCCCSPAAPRDRRGDAADHPFISDNHVVVSFELNDAYTTRSARRSPAACGRRSPTSSSCGRPAWIDRTVGTTIVATTDQHDNLTRRHTLTRTVDGRVEDVLVTEDDAVVKTWLTKWSRVPVADTARLDPARDYYVRGDDAHAAARRIAPRADARRSPARSSSRSCRDAARFRYLDREAVDHPQLVVSAFVLRIAQSSR